MLAMKLFCYHPRFLVKALIAVSIIFSTIAEASTAEIYRRAQSGDVVAMREMGRRAFYGTRDVKRNYHHALQWFEKAAEEDDAIAMLYLGDLYRLGKGAPKDVARALEYYVSADENGAKKAKEHALKLPFRTIENQVEEWAEEGDEMCLAYLLEGYIQGKHGVGKDLEKAQEYYPAYERRNADKAKKLLEGLSEDEKALLSSRHRKEKEEARLKAQREEEARKLAESKAQREREQAEREAKDKHERAEREAREKAFEAKRELERAITSNNVDKAQSLVESGVKIDSSDAADALINATSRELSPELLRLVQNLGVNLSNVRRGDDSLLHIAVKSNKAENLKVLLAAKLNPDISDGDGYSALHYAVRKHDNESAKNLVQILLESGATPNIKAKDGCTPLIAAVREGCYEGARLLLQAGVSPNQTDDNLMITVFSHINNDALRLKFTKLLLKHGAKPDEANSNGFTPLALAVEAENHECINELLKHGADVHWKLPTTGITLLHFAAVHAQNASIIKQLVDAGADVNAQLIQAPKANTSGPYKGMLKSGNTPLHCALSLNDEENRRAIANTLIDCGAKLDIPNHSGETPLMLAAGHGDYLLTRKIEEALEKQDMEENIIKYGGIGLGVVIILIMMNAVKRKKPVSPAPVASPSPAQSQVAPKKIKRKVKSTAAPKTEETVFFIMTADGSQEGPFSTTELRKRVAAGITAPDALAWKEGMPEWLPIAEILAQYKA